MRLDIGLVNEMLFEYIITPDDSVFLVGPSPTMVEVSEERWIALSPWLSNNCLNEKANRWHTTDKRKITMFLLKFT